MFAYYRWLPIKQLKWVRFNHNTWEPWEDQMMKDFVNVNGRKWSQLVQHCLPHRSPKQCELRYTDVLMPNRQLGPLSEDEKSVLKKAIAELGEGKWAQISREYLPHRAPRQLRQEWISCGRVPRQWTPQEDQVLKEAVDAFGDKQWAKIVKFCLPHRTNIQIRSRYRLYLAPEIKKGPWTQEELSLLLRRTIIHGEKWDKVAEGIPGRQPEQCYRKWLEIDPGVDKGEWSPEEERLFWERMSELGSYSKVAKHMPGRNNVVCATKYKETLRDKELQALYGDELVRKKSENIVQWRKRVASIVCSWFDSQMNFTIESNQSLRAYKKTAFSQEEIDLLNKLASQSKEPDWKAIAGQLGDRSPAQCRRQYEKLTEKIKTGKWTPEEDQRLKDAVKQCSVEGWTAIAARVPARSRIQCLQRWKRLCQQADSNILRNTPLTTQEKELLFEGYKIFGADFNAIQKSYLPNRRAEQLKGWWHYNNPSSLDDITRRHHWTEEQDEALKYAIQRTTNDDGKIPWPQVAKLIEGKTPRQCRCRWQLTLNPSVKRGSWSMEEELMLLELVQKESMHKDSNIGLWTKIGKELNRAAVACRAKYQSMRSKSRFAI